MSTSPLRFVGESTLLDDEEYENQESPHESNDDGSVSDQPPAQCAVAPHPPLQPPIVPPLASIPPKRKRGADTDIDEETSKTRLRKCELHRLCRAASIARYSSTGAHEMRTLAAQMEYEYVRRMLKAARNVTLGRQRTMVTIEDVLYAVRQQDETLYF